MGMEWRCKSSEKLDRRDLKRCRKVWTPREALKEAASGNHEPTDRNQVEATSAQGERAYDREALTIKGRRRRLGGCVVKSMTLTRGDLALCLKGQRSTRKRAAERAVSRGRSRLHEAGRGRASRRPEVFGGAKGRTERRAKRP